MTNRTAAPRDGRLTWTAGLAVALGAGVATAHGLYQVAAAARVAAPIAWLYPLITDGLALVAYAATARLHHGGRRYAAGIVILAAGLSGLAQAVYLAGGLDHTTAAPVGLRFGVGAWPAIAAALTAHLLHLIGTDSGEPVEVAAECSASISQSTDPLYKAASNPSVQSRTTPERPSAVQPAADVYSRADGLNAVARSDGRRSAVQRARATAEAHRDRHGALPTVTELMRLAEVARGTAGNALKTLRNDRPALHVVNNQPENRNPK